VSSLFLIIIAVLQPEGVAGANEQAYYHFKQKFLDSRARRRTPPRAEAVPAPVNDDMASVGNTKSQA
jgi:hypothetical protein